MEGDSYILQFKKTYHTTVYRLSIEYISRLRFAEATQEPRDLPLSESQ